MITKFLPILGLASFLGSITTGVSASEIPVGNPIAVTTIVCDTVDQVKEILDVNAKGDFAAMLVALKASHKNAEGIPDCGMGPFTMVPLSTEGKVEGIDRGYPDRSTAYIIRVKYGRDFELIGFAVAFAPTVNFEPGMESQSFKTPNVIHNPLIHI